MKNVVLLGSGHAHLEILKALTTEEIARHRFFLISPCRQTYYSGLIPRLITDEIKDEDLAINSADFAELKGFKFIQDEVESLDQVSKTVSLKSGKKINFDLLSINIGGTPTRIPSDTPFTNIYLRPFDEFMPKWREVQRICNACVNPRFLVVGGGAAAVEVAAALRIRLNKNQEKTGEVHLISKSSRLCESYPQKISEQIRLSLLRRGIKVHLNEPVNHIHQKALKLSHDVNLEFNFIFIVTPTQPSKLLFGKVDSKLRLSANIFAAGDATEMIDHPHLPRSGVIAVHQGRHLVQNIKDALNDLEPSNFRIPAKQLNILIAGEDSARLVWGDFSFEGKWPLRIKNWIDRRYMSGFENVK